MMLTKTTRQAFVRAVMADVPQVDYQTKFQDWATKRAVEVLPPAVRKLWDDKKTREYVRIKNPFGIYSGLTARVPGISDDALQALLNEEREKMQALSREQQKARDAMTARLEGAALSVRTRKALAELLPEFEKYLPANNAEANRQVPAVANLVADLTKAGWPKKS